MHLLTNFVYDLGDFHLKKGLKNRRLVNLSIYFKLSSKLFQEVVKSIFNSKKKSLN